MISETTADPYAQYPIESFEIDRKANENKNIVSFELTTVIDKPNEYIPKRQLIGNCCQWQYRSSECSYTGNNYFNKDDVVVSTLAADVCGKRLSSCKKDLVKMVYYLLVLFQQQVKRNEIKRKYKKIGIATRKRRKS